MSTVSNVPETLEKQIHDLKERLSVLDSNNEELRKREADLRKSIEEHNQKAAEVKASRKAEFQVEDETAVQSKSSFQRLIEMPAGNNEQVKAVHEANDKVYLLSQLLNRDPRSLKSYTSMIQQNRAVSDLRKALDTATANAGNDWVPTGFSATLYELLALDLRVSALHPRIAMPTNPYTPPSLTAFPTAYYVPESKTDESVKIPTSSVTTDNFTLTAKKIAVRTVWSEELNEDSIIPMLPILQKNLARAIARGEENALINGDTTATHQDSDITDSKDVCKIWSGYRKLTSANAKADLSTLSMTTLRGLRGKMGKYAVSPSELAWVMGPSVYMKLMTLDQVLTVEKYGTMATVLTGELGKIDGIPVIVSEFVRENLNASGVYDGSTTTKTMVQLVYRPGFLLGDRRRITVKVKEDPETDQQIMVASERIAAASPYDTTTQYVFGLGYNITTA